jgi:hypothetical protein
MLRDWDIGVKQQEDNRAVSVKSKRPKRIENKGIIN